MNATLQFSAVRKSKLDIEIGFNIGSGNVSLYWTSENDVNSKTRSLIEKNAVSPYRFEDPLKAQRRIYFIIESGGKSYLFSERTLPVSGLNNFRDFGGYRGAGGKHVKWGVLYRSNHLHNLNQQALTYIESLNIQTVIDYRSVDEIAKSPNSYIGERKNFHLDAAAQTAELAAQFSAEPSDEDRVLIESVMRDIPAELVNGHGEQVLEQYRNFVTSKKSKDAFKSMIQILLDKESCPHIQHCRGGKDRTGYGVLLVLSMLGVSEDDIIADYMLTHANRLERNNIKMESYRKITNDNNVLDYLHTLIDTRESFIIEVFNTMRALSGSVAGYIRDELDFTDADFAKMQDNFLIKPF